MREVTKDEVREWKRGVPEASGLYWYRSTRTGSAQLPCYFVVGLGVQFVGTASIARADTDAKWFAKTEFCPLREKAPE